MAKTKPPTPQEIYRQRRLREEQERTAYLPPGLINHGNTCFMNSVLQGLIATRLLSDLIHFSPISDVVQEHSAVSIAGERSPQLTNGHNLAGPFELPWVNTMPIGDAFLSLVYKSWEHQAKHQRNLLSARNVLGAVGRRYDQYLDFAQQDAHEFLRIILDAMRMEEQDIIKQRRGKSDVELVSFVDMVFGGTLTSVLVCQKCKHISQTYEDFNDISLSIKPEDYTKGKRHRLKNIAKRLTSLTTPSKPTTADMKRTSSVPATVPDEHESKDEDDSPVLVDPADGLPVIEQVEQEDTKWSQLSRRLSLTVGRGKGKESKKRNRISAPIVEGIQLDEVAPNATDTPSRPDARTHRASLMPGALESSSNDTSTFLVLQPVPPPPANGSSISAVDQTPPASLPNKSPPKDLPGAHTSKPHVPSPLSKFQPTMSSPPPVQPVSRSRSPIRIARSKSPKPPKPTAGETEYLRRILADVETGSSNPFHALFKSTPSTTSLQSTKPPDTQRPGLGRVNTPPFGPGGNVWFGGKSLTGIEECLRMFTAVEVLDGENMVGCRRCWKIANGVYPHDDGHDDGDSDKSPSPAPSPPALPPKVSSPDVPPNDRTAKGVSHSPPTPARPGPLERIQTSSAHGLHIPTSISTPTVSFYGHHDMDPHDPCQQAVHGHALDKSDTRSISSLPVVDRSHSPGSSTNSSRSGSPSRRGHDASGRSSLTMTPGGLPIPAIETTAPADVDVREETGVPADRNRGSSLAIPSRGRSPRKQDLNGVAGDITSTEDESSGYDTDTTNDSINPAADASSQTKVPYSPTAAAASYMSKRPAAAKHKPTILRPAYKRYLISTPPPVLVIHLKRFQQQQSSILKGSAAAFLSFSHGFKKLDDYISFPELLDLGPYVAPRREDYGLPSLKNNKGAGPNGKRPGEEKFSRKDDKERGKHGKKVQEKCMYRLYAVVVHIGNMLGGHYIAYVALPSRSPLEGEGLAASATVTPLSTVTNSSDGPNSAGNALPGDATPPQPPSLSSSQTLSSESTTPAATQPSMSKATAPASQSPTISSQSTATASSKTQSQSQEQQPAPPRDPQADDRDRSSQAQSQTRSPDAPGDETQVPGERQWAYISDTVVRLTTLDEVMGAKAYMCMYERC